MQDVIADNNAEALAAAAEDLHAYQDRFEVMICDVSSYAQICRLRNRAFERFSCVDCLTNNAGAAVTRALPWDDLDGWKKQLDINLWGIVHGCHAFVPALIAQERAATSINTH